MGTLRSGSARGRERQRLRRIKDQTHSDSIAIEFQRSSVTLICFAPTSHPANVNKLNQIKPKEEHVATETGSRVLQPQVQDYTPALKAAFSSTSHSAFKDKSSFNNHTSCVHLIRFHLELRLHLLLMVSFHLRDI